MNFFERTAYSRNIKCFAMMAVMAASICQLAAQQLDVLVIGSTRSFSKDKYQTTPRVQEPFNSQLVATELRKILQGDTTFSSVNLVFEDIYAARSGDANAQVYSLLGYYYWPDGRQQRLNNLKGLAGTQWDYVVIMSDPSYIASTPGVYAKGVKKLVDTIRQGTAQPILMMPWPHAGSTVPTADFGEVCYRVGDSGEIPVAPAGFAWDSLGTKDTGTHPTPNGAYLAAASLYSQIFNRSAVDSNYTYNDTLATHAHQTVQNHKTQSHYSGNYSFVHPQLGSAYTGRSLNVGANNSSTEKGFVYEGRYNSSRHMNELASTQLFLAMTNTGGNFIQRFGLTNSLGRKDLNFAYQIREWDSPIENNYDGGLDMLYGLDYGSRGITGDHATSFGLIGSASDLADGDRCLPVWGLWAAVNDEMGLARPWHEPIPDGRHFAADVNEAVAAYALTLLTGRCPIGKNGTAAERQRRRIGYETAWTMSTLNLRAPGFSVFPSTRGPKTLVMGEEEQMTAYFVNAPKSPVTVNISVSPASAAIVSPSVLTFDGTNHDAIRNIRLLTLPNNSKVQNFDVVFTTSSADMCFDGLSDTWAYTAKRNSIESVNSYTLVELPHRKVSVFQNTPLDIDLNVPGADQFNTTLLAPRNGTLSWVGGVVRYQPTVGFAGEDGFSYYTIHEGKLYKGHLQIEVLATGSAVRVSVAASDANAIESGDVGSWTITRQGSTADNLVVAYALSGTATAGADYTVSVATPVTIPAGSASVNITLTPVGDVVKEGKEFAALTLLPGSSYKLGADLSTITIQDDDNAAPQVNVGADQATELNAQALWTPGFKRDGKLAGWYDAADSTSFTVDGTGVVTKCNDKSGYGNNLDKNPTYGGPKNGIRTLNGKNVFDCQAQGGLRFTGMYRNENAGNLAVYLVADLDGTSGTIMNHTSGSLPGFTWSAAGALARSRGDFTGFNLNHGVGPNMSGIVWNISSQSVSGYVNGTNTATSTGYTQALSPSLLEYGVNPDAGLAELVMTEDVSVETRELIEGYLAWKWGRYTLLPETHKFRGHAPYLPMGSLDLSGSISDADNPSPTSLWSLVDGPSHVDFSNPTSSNTTVRFYVAGTYRLRLRVSDGLDSSFDDILVTVTDGAKPVVSAAAFDASASETSIDAGSFRITRSGPTTNPLTVSYSFAGTAALGSDYNPNLASSVTIGAGQSSALVSITPIDDAAFGERDENVRLVLASGAQYVINSLAASADVIIRDNDNHAPTVDAGDNQTLFLRTDILWTPADISKVAWYDANDSATITLSSGKVSQWNDKSGNGRHAVQTVSTQRPTYTANNAMINNMPSIGDIGATGKIGMLTPSLTAKHVYVVTYYKDGIDATFDDYPTLLSGSATGGQYRVMGNIATADFVNSINFNDLGTFKNGSTTSSITAVLPMPASIFKFKSSVARTQTYALGYNQTSTSRDWQGHYSEFIFTDGTEGDANEKILEGYLAHKWKLDASLPNDHPHKTKAPSKPGTITSLNGAVGDADGETLAVSWSVVSGNASAVSFSNPNSLNPKATFTEPGTYVLRLSASDGIDLTSDDVTIVIWPPASGAYASWMGGGFANPFNATGPTDNPDGDTYNNTLEFAFGMDPTLARSSSLATDGSLHGSPVPQKGAGNVMEFYFIRRDDNGASGSVRYTVQFSNDLNAYSDSVTTPTFVADSSVNSAYEVVKVPFPAGSTFARIKVEHVP